MDTLKNALILLSVLALIYYGGHMTLDIELCSTIYNLAAIYSKINQTTRQNSLGPGHARSSTPRNNTTPHNEIA